jgi:O-antigen/teichoic acid export membrane protein
MAALPETGVNSLGPDEFAPAAAVPAQPSLRRRAIRGTTWILLGQPIGYALRLASSLVLTRLLFPEAFGVMATITAVAAAVEMCSELGIVQAVVQHARGDTDRFLMSAWSITVVRGFWLAGVIAALAWPCARFFHEPVLFPALLVIAISPAIRGFANPRIFCWYRDLAQGKLVGLSVLSEVVRISGTVAMAYAFRSVWALVLGWLVSESARVGWSYLLERARPRWHWDRAAVRELVRFGRFILISNVLGFLALRLDAVCVAKFLGMERAGVYYVGATIAGMLNGIFTQLSGSVLFPALSRMQDNARALRERTTEIAGLLIVIVVPACIVLIANADTFFTLLYDRRYADADLALRWLAVAACCGLLGDIFNAPLMATGRPHWGTVGTLVRVLGFVALAPLGGIFGVQGYAAAVAGSSVAYMLLILIACARSGYVAVERLWPAVAATAAFGGVLLVGWLVALPPAPRLADRLVAAGLCALGLAVFWAWQRKPLMKLVWP